MTKTAPSSEFSETFYQGMRDRMAMSYFKYGPISEAYPHKVNALESLQKRIDKYLETGNTEWLMDVANFAMIEFIHPSHRNAHFKATDSKESPGRAAYDTQLEGTSASNQSLSDKEYRELHDQKSRK